MPRINWAPKKKEPPKPKKKRKYYYRKKRSKKLTEEEILKKEINKLKRELGEETNPFKKENNNSEENLNNEENSEEDSEESDDEEELEEDLEESDDEEDLEEFDDEDLKQSNKKENLNNNENVQEIDLLKALKKELMKKRIERSANASFNKKKKNSKNTHPDGAWGLMNATCLRCGTAKKTQFYVSRNPKYQYFGKVPWCKDCIEVIYNEYFNKYNSSRIAIMYMCRALDIAYYNNIFYVAEKEAEGRGFTVKQTYFKNLNSLGGGFTETTSFDHGECSAIIEGASFEMALKNEKEFIIPIEVSSGTPDSLSDKETEIKIDVIRLIGYDPFLEYPICDQRFLYSELLSYLDEDTLEDTFKLSQIIQVVNNNNQIRNIDLSIARLSSNQETAAQSEGKIIHLSRAKAAIVGNTDKIASANQISVNHRTDKKAGKSTLTALMRKYREFGFEDAEQDYFDQSKAYGIKLVAEISDKAIIEQLQFDENDINDMFFMQRKLIQDLQEKILDIEEKNRILQVEIDDSKKQGDSS